MLFRSKALAESLDKEKILSETLGEEGKVMDAPIPEGWVGYYPDI